MLFVRIFFPVYLLLFVAPAAAITGHAPVALKQGRSAVMIVGARGTVCTGAAIATDLVLTAGHCTVSGTDYKIADGIGMFAATLATVTGISRHPNFNLQTMLAHRATADVALMKLSRPLPETIVPAMLSRSAAVPKPGDHFTVLGYGLASRGNEGSLGTLRAAALVATGQPGNLQLRLFDPATKGVRAGMGACTGDSGAPVYEKWRADGRGELVDRPQPRRRLRRAHRRHPAHALPRMDRRYRPETRLAAAALNRAAVQLERKRESHIIPPSFVSFCSGAAFRGGELGARH
jgi:hypothetical protein